MDGWHVNGSEGLTNLTYKICRDKYVHIDLPPVGGYFVNYMRLHGPIGIVICVLGIFTNIANIIVLTRPQMKTPVNSLFTFMALGNLLLLTSHLPLAIGFFSMRLRDNPFFNFQSEGPDKMRLLQICANTGQMFHFIATWHSIAVAIFRLSFSQPGIRGLKTTQLRTAYITTTVIIILSCLVTTLNWFTTKVKVSRYRPCLTPLPQEDLSEAGVLRMCNETYCMFKPHSRWILGRTDLVKENPWVYTVNHWLLGIMGKILPSILLAILTILLVRAMSSAELRRRRLLSKNGQDKRPSEHQRTTVMLLTVVVIYFLVEFPAGVFLLLKTFDKAFIRSYNYVIDVFDNVQYLSFAIIFFLFVAMSKKFRKTFYKTIILRLVVCPSHFNWRGHKGILIQNSSTTKSTQSFTADVSYVPSESQQRVPGAASTLL